MAILKRVGREVVYKGKILEFCQDEIQTSKGHHVTWDFLNHKGAAAIVPVMMMERFLWLNSGEML